MTFNPLDLAGRAVLARVCRTADYKETCRINVVAGAQLPVGLTERGVVSAEGCSTFLAADSARWIAGSCLVVDGGYASQ